MGKAHVTILLMHFVAAFERINQLKLTWWPYLALWPILQHVKNILHHACIGKVFREDCLALAALFHLDSDRHVTCDMCRLFVTRHNAPSALDKHAYCAGKDPSSNVEHPILWRIDMPLHVSRSAKLLRGIQFHCRGCWLSNEQSLMKGSKSEITERNSQLNQVVDWT